MDQKLEKFIALHKPEHKNDPMVYEVWQDGEVTLTKGEGLFRQRNLHCACPGLGRDFVNPLALPVRLFDNGSIIVADWNAAQEAIAILTEGV